MMGLDTIIGLLLQYRYAIMFPAAIVEGPVVTLIVGFLIAGGSFDFFSSFILIIAADLCSDMIYYAIGRFGGEVSLRKFFRVTKEKIIQLETNFKKYSFRTLTIGKLLHGVGIVVLIAAGVAKVSLVEFIGYNAIATVVKTIVLLAVGYFFGNWIAQLRSVFDYLAFGTVVLALIGAAIVLFARRK